MRRIRPRHVVIGLLTLLALLLVGWTTGSHRLAHLPPIRTTAPVETTLHTNGQPIRLIAVQTGTVSIKGAHHAGCLPEGTPYPLRFASILADPRLGARMPIWSYVLVHSEGVFIVDPGPTPSFNDDASWTRDPISGKLVRSFLRIDVDESETLPERLAALGVAISDVRAIVLTHQHVDHTGAIPAFPNADVWTTRAEEGAAQFIGAVPWRWRNASTRVRLVDVEGQTVETTPWPRMALTSDGRIEAFHTPGHTPGSITVRLRADEGEVWFVGDISFRAADLRPDAETAGIHTDVAQVRALQSWFSARPEPKAFLPAHDEAVPTTLSQTREWPKTP